MNTLDPDNTIAERVRQQLHVFPDKFHELGEGGELRRVLTTTANLSGPRVKQAPEHFTEQYLVEPILRGLGFRDPTSEEYHGSEPHYVRRPTTFSKIEPKQPDYLLKNVSDDLICILEAKAANREQEGGTKTDATDDITEYIESDTFCKYLLERENRYLVGIGTDGLRWTLWWKDLSTEAVTREDTKEDLSDAVTEIARQRAVIEGDPRRTTPELREFLRCEFVPYFAARNLPEYVTD